MKLSINVTILKQRIFFYILLIVIMLISCFNDQDPDYFNYEMNYNAIGTGYTEHLLYTIEPLFSVLCVVFYRMGFSYFQFHFIIYIFIFLLFRKVILDYAKTPFLALLCFVLFPFLTFCVQIRNAMGAVIVMYGIRFLKENTLKGNLKFALAVVIASMIHTSCIVYLLMLMVNSKKFYSYLGCFVIVEIIIVYTILPEIMQLIYSITSNRRFMVYNTGVLMPIVIRHTLPIMLLAGIVVYCMKFSNSRCREEESNYNKILAKCSLVICSCVVLIKVNINFFRIIYFMFPIMNITIFNFSLDKNKRLIKNDRYLLRGCSIVLSMFYFIMLFSPLQEETFNNVTKAVIPWIK